MEANERELKSLAIFVSEIRLDVSRKSLQYSSRYRWNRRIWSTRRAAPKKSNMSLEVSLVHNFAQFLQTIILVTKGCDKRIQCAQMINKIFAWNLSSRAKKPNASSAGNVGTMRPRPIRLTLPICPCWLLFNDTRDLVGVECIAGKPKCGESSDRVVRFRCGCFRGHSHTHP